MNNEWKVTNFEISKALKELGVEQNSERYWNFNDRVPEQGWYLDDENLAYPPKNTISAFSPAELGRMLPCNITATTIVSNSKLKGFFNYSKWEGVDGEEYHRVQYNVNSGYAIEETETADTMANAMGKMLEYLIKEGLI